MSQRYRDFLARKSQIDNNTGFEPLWMPDFLYDFQRHLVEWAIRKGRAAIWADCLAAETTINSPDGDMPIGEAFARRLQMRVYRPVIGFIHPMLPGHWHYREVPISEAGVKIRQHVELTREKEVRELPGDK